MSKRASQFERKEKDFYRTPEAAVIPLLPHLQDNTLFIEPCCGDGALIKVLESYGHSCFCASDADPNLYDDAFSLDACSFNYKANMEDGFVFITNPPWTRAILHPIIENLSNQAPTWLLFDADWIHTKQARPLLNRLVKVVSVGRVKWFPETNMTGKDNCAWYLFDKPRSHNIIQFHGAK